MKGKILENFRKPICATPLIACKKAKIVNEVFVSTGPQKNIKNFKNIMQILLIDQKG